MEIWTVPGFTRVRELGEGDSGRVVQAVDDLTQTPVAIKYLEERVRRDERFQSEFPEQARRLSRLEDPNLVQFYEFVESPDGAAVIMELVEGVSLARLLGAVGQIGPLPALALFSGALIGLATLHDAGIAHGACTPANLLIDAKGTGQLTDAAAGTAEDAGKRTGPYLAPEQWGGAAPSATGDLYAATAVFFHCLTGQAPFAARSLSALAKAHRTEPVPLEPVPEPLRGLVSAGLAKTPEDRPRSAAGFLATLDDAARSAYGPGWEAQGRHLLAELATKAAATPLSAPSRPARRRTRTEGGPPRRGRLIAATAAVITLVTAVAYGTTQILESRGSTTPTRQSTSPPPKPTPTTTPTTAGLGTAPPQTPVALAAAIDQAAAAKRGAAFVHRGEATAARGVFSFTPSAPAAYDMTVWSTARGDRFGRRTRAIVVGETVYVAEGGWHPAPAVKHTGRADATRVYASLAAQTRWSTSVHDILALVRSSRTVTRSGLTYSGTASLPLLARDRTVAPLYAAYAGSPGARVTFKVWLTRDYLPRSLQVVVTPRTGGRARAQVFRTTYSGWGREVAITAP
ncbi:MAG TPA: serine/threonine-protein kinase [Actinomadura sp.]|jgi:hypothetical protein|nr:serine/threonine-protein kinase [Actinomadura sp.]